jgi:5-methylcytosine-specific restriction protein B
VTLEGLAAQSGYSRDWLASIFARLRRKKHLVSQGPPGTGKSFLAKALARLAISGTAGITEMIQFHPAYSYEDFVQGIRPKPRHGGITFLLTAGHFLRFCERAREVDPAPAVLVIDEFNRADLARVFGELMLLLEYREESVALAAGGARFSIPANVLIIATMNTADRSIALVDNALRRRFSFVTMTPDYAILAAYLRSHELPADSLVNALRTVNEAIADPNYHMGISYFLQDGANLKQHLKEIWEGEIEPYLNEYFYDRREAAAALSFATLSKTTLSDWT